MTDRPASIAIIGGACRFPNASNPGELADILLGGRDAVANNFPLRWNPARYHHPAAHTPGRAYTLEAGLIGNVTQFDPELFGISPREAQQMDPQQHLLLEVVHEALEDAGLSPTQLAGQNVAVFVGASFSDHSHRRFEDIAAIDAYFMTGTAMSVLANRMSHAMDLKGPSLTVDTACSSALVALHLACRALRAGEVDTAIVGAVNLLLTPQPFVGFSQATMLSPTGRCRPFSAAADGYVRSEGAGAVVLRRRDALAMSDAPRAWILGSGVNSDGHTNGISLPNGTAQAALLKRVYGEAKVDPDQLSYFEAHGTGTRVGDPIEAGAVGSVLGRHRSAALPIASAKSSFGHLEAASGMVGLFSALMVLERKALPRLAHCTDLNPGIDFAGLGLRPLRESEALLQPESAVIGVNSFGFGGTNAHTILAAAPSISRPTTRRTKPASKTLPPLLLSARSAVALGALADRWSTFLQTLTDDELPAVLRGAARGRASYGHRLIQRSESAQALAAGLAAWRRGQPSAVITGQDSKGGLAFVFSGNGAQWAGMGRQAMQGNPGFAAAIKALDARMTPKLGWSVREALRKPDNARLRRTDVAQPLLFAVQVALVQTLAAAGVTPDAVTGHSVGEIAAAWASGALSLDSAIDVLVARSTLQFRTHGSGRMAVCSLDVADAEALFATHGLALEIAATNAPRSVTIVGPEADIRAFGRLMKEADIFFSQLDLDYAFHSSLLAPIEPELRAMLADVVSTPPRIPFVSTVTGLSDPNLKLDADYWWRNVREPVRFDRALETLGTLGMGCLLEIGPHPVLQFYMRETQRKSVRRARVLSSLSRTQESGDPVFAVLAACHIAGKDIAQGPLFEGPRRSRGLPFYPYQRQSITLAPSRENHDLSLTPRTHPLLGFATGDSGLDWRAQIDTGTQPWLADHVVDSEILIPATGMIDMVLAAARTRLGAREVLDVIDLEIRRPLALEAGGIREIWLQIIPDRDTFEIASRKRLSDEPWTVHATGRLAAGESIQSAFAQPAPAGRRITPAELYDSAERLGLKYGPEFQTVESVVLLGDQEAVATLIPPTHAHAARAAAGALLDPAWSDGALQALIGLLSSTGAAGGDMLLPWHFGRVRYFGPDARVPRTVHLRITRAGPRAIQASLLLDDAEGQRIAEMTGAWFRRLPTRRRREGPSMWMTALRPLAPLNGRLDRMPSPGVAGTAEEPGEVAILIEACITSAAHAAVAGLATDGAVIPDELIASGTVHLSSARLLTQMLDWLANDGLAFRHGGLWELAPNDLPPADEVWRALFAGTPEAAGELALLGAAIERLPRLLSDGPAVLGTAAPALREQMLQDGPDGHATISALAARVAALANACPADRPMRILEIGARGPALARSIARAIPTLPAGLHYTVAAGSPDSSEPGPIGMPHTTMVWDTSEEPPAALALAGFDLIIGAYAVAFGPGARDLLARLQPLLATNGRMLLAEPRPNRFWQLQFAIDPAIAETQAERMPDDPGWQTLLASAGFAGRAVDPIGGAVWPACVIEAESSQPAAAPVLAKPAQPPLFIASTEGELRAQILSATLNSADIAHRSCTVPELAMLLPDGLADILLVAGDPQDPAPLLIDLAAVAASLALRKDTNLCILTTGEPTGEPVAEALEAACRVLANEANTLNLRIIRVSRSFEIHGAIQEILRERAAGHAEPELRLAPGRRYAPRVRAAARPLERATHAKLAVANPGRLDTLFWQSFVPPKPGHGEVAIEVATAGLNFRDLMWALGVLPDEALIDGFGGATLGLECAGTVSAVGPGVTRLRVGDRVMALAPAALATTAVTRESACLALPDNLDFAAAASVPVAFITVCYSLGHLAQLAEGETLLVHGGAGGVGLAAIQYARHRGAKVIATAGSETKRALLRLLGVDHVFDSRSLRFADEVMEVTGGVGVDVVLNSLSGEAMRRSLTLLAPFGRFIELGKRDFFADTSVGVRPFRRNASYYGVDADHLAQMRPSLAGTVFREIETLFAQGALRPLPHRIIGYADVMDAFRVMQWSGHIGKLVLSVDRAPPRVPPASTGFQADADGVYLVTGGLAGFGLEAARWLADHGANRLALLGRRGLQTPGATEAIAALQAAGCDARAYPTDVTDASALGKTLDMIRSGHGPIVGVVHAAMVLHDGLMSKLDADAFRTVLAPKLAGAEALDRLTRKDNISLFLLFSSATTILANPGQANYVAANAALEAIAERRRAEGLAALAIAWGPIADAGILQRDTTTAASLARRFGSQMHTAREALDLLPEMLAQRASTIAPVAIQWESAKRDLHGIAAPRFSEVAGRSRAAGGDAGNDLRERLLQQSPEEATSTVQTVLAELIGDVLRLPPSTIQPTARLTEIGVDSLMGVELRLAIEERFGAHVPMLAITDQTTLSSLSDIILQAIGIAPAAATATLAEQLAARYEATDLAPANAAGA
jgi:acyl transferase domain-containing protein/NADPH:quinone reductase-like Zn-dependent oxidoreductase/acyl carrier protein/NADP-dependent 3-hydroxy acid dehydrogenase YdfG